MANNKPTPEELKAKEEEAIKAAEQLEKDPSLFKEEDPEAEELAKTEANSEEGSGESEDSPPLSEEPEHEEEEPEAEPSKEIYKKKFSESSKEAQKIQAKNRVINKAIIDAEETPEPTEEELIKEFPDWDVMSETERGLAKETVISRNWRQIISKAKEQATKIEKWTESIEEFVDNPQTLIDSPELEGKTDEFREFATREENNNVPFNTLIGAFLYEHSKSNKSHKGKMFENGSGGPNDKPQPKDGKISLEEARKLRETNYGKWKEYNSKGLIDYNL